MRPGLGRVVLAALLLLASIPFGGVARLTLQALVILLAGGELFVRAIAGLAKGRIGFPALMTVAVAGAIGLTVLHPTEGHLVEAGIIVVLNAISDLIEEWGLTSTRQALERLLGQSERMAMRWDGSTWALAPVSDLRPGDRLKVLPGERVPVDGTVLKGQAAVDQQALTGESVPVALEPGDTILGGTIPTDGALEVAATATFDDSRLARVAALIAEGAKHKSDTERLVDRFAAVFTPLMLGLFALANIYGLVVPEAPRQEIFYNSLVLLLISCPCAFVISSPVTMTSALAQATRLGLIVRGSKFIEAVARLRGMVFDKTGTLTEGRPVVAEVSGAAGDEALAIGAALAGASEHPLSRALHDEARRRGVKAPALEFAKSLPGLGVVGRAGGHDLALGSARLAPHQGLEEPPPDDGGSGHLVHLWQDQAHRATFRLTDAVRPSAGAALKGLWEIGITTAILSGDREENVNGLADTLGINRRQAGLMPEEKLAALDKLTAEWGPVAMVGDGINDTPSLARADVGIAVGAGGTQLAMETADVVLMGDDLGQLPVLVRLARRARAVLRQNITFSLGAKFFLAAGALLGGVDLMGAAMADAGLALVVVVNSLRLRQPARAREA